MSESESQSQSSPESSDSKPQIDFGFKSVAWNEKASMVRGVFDRVAARYDLMNDLISLGLHRLWKREIVASLNLKSGMNIMDLAGGTGDIMRLIIRESERLNLDLNSMQFMIADINAAMMEVGRGRLIDDGILTPIQWLCGDAEALPVCDNQFDIVMISFGLRNVTDRPKALAEIYRVLKPGGQFVCLEMSTFQGPKPLKSLYEKYLLKGLPFMGKMVSRDAESYRYLGESVLKFPEQDALKEMIVSAGFAQARYHNYLKGVVAVHRGFKL